METASSIRSRIVVSIPRTFPSPSCSSATPPPRPAIQPDLRPVRSRAYASATTARVRESSEADPLWTRLALVRSPGPAGRGATPLLALAVRRGLAVIGLGGLVGLRGVVRRRLGRRLRVGRPVNGRRPVDR